MFLDEPIPTTFLNHSIGILAATARGLTGTEIVKCTSAWAVKHDVNIPHSIYPFDAPNKRTALRENLLAFSPRVQYQILKELCDLQFRTRPEVKELKTKLVSRFGSRFEPESPEQVPESLIVETKHWLEGYKPAYDLYVSAEAKLRAGTLSRNLLDDLRLCLESILKDVLRNQKSLENQLEPIGKFLAAKGTSPEFRNMLSRLLDYYAKYQNTYVKHSDAVVHEELEFVFELTSSFIKHVIRLHRRK